MARQSEFEQSVGMGARVLKGGGRIKFPSNSGFQSEFKPNKIPIGLNGISRGNWDRQDYQPEFATFPGAMIVAADRNSYDLVPMNLPGPAFMIISQFDERVIGENELVIPVIRTALARLSPQFLMGVLPLRGRDRFVITSLTEPDIDLVRFNTALIQLAGTPTTPEAYERLMVRYLDKGWLGTASLCFGAVTPDEGFDTHNNFVVTSVPGSE